MKFKAFTTVATAFALITAPTVAFAADPEFDEEDQVLIVAGVSTLVLALVVLLGILKNKKDTVTPPPPPPVSP